LSLFGELSRRNVFRVAIAYDDPRYQEIELLMLSNMNRDREIVGLQPRNANYEVELVL